MVEVRITQTGATSRLRRRSERGRLRPTEQAHRDRRDACPTARKHGGLRHKEDRRDACPAPRAGCGRAGLRSGACRQAAHASDGKRLRRRGEPAGLSPRVPASRATPAAGGPPAAAGGVCRRRRPAPPERAGPTASDRASASRQAGRISYCSQARRLAPQGRQARRLSCAAGRMWSGRLAKRRMSASRSCVRRQTSPPARGTSGVEPESPQQVGRPPRLAARRGRRRRLPAPPTCAAGASGADCVRQSKRIDRRDACPTARQHGGLRHKEDRRDACPTAR